MSTASTVDLNTDVDPSRESGNTFAADWAAWHREQEAKLSAPHGFLAITSLHWLSETAQRFDDAPGSWSTGAEGVVVTLDEDQKVLIGGSWFCCSS